MLPAVILCGTFVVLLLFIFSDIKKPAKYPPGPPWLPLIGNWLLFRKYVKETKFTHIAWQRFAEDYGHLVGLRLGRDRIVIVSEYKLAKDILSREEFEGRPDGFIFRLRSMGKRLGVAFVDGSYGVEQRRFCLKHLREFSLGSSVMEHRISEEATSLVSWLKQQDGPVDLQPILDMCVFNSLWATLTGNRYSLSDCRLGKLIHYIHTLFQLRDMSGGLLNQMPFLRFLPPERDGYKLLLHIHNEIWSFLWKTINDHKSTLTDYTRDYVDAFLHEMRQRNGSSNSTFTEEQLLMTLFDLFMAGSDTTSNTLMFIIIYLLRYPEVQAKAQAEVDSVIGHKTQPTLAHRPRMCYVDAVIMEVQRHVSVAPMTAAHRAKTDVMVQEFLIPQDTVVLISLYSIHMNKDYWGDPESFRPERFLDKEGHLVQCDRLIPYSFGRRRCLGETLARASLFLFLSALLQNFTILLPPGGKIPDLHVVDGSVLSPAKFGGCIFKTRV